MKPHIKYRASGELSLIQRRNGKVIHREDNTPNLLLNGAFTTAAVLNPFGSAYLRTDEVVPSVALDGTWDQSGNTVTRATGTGVFTSGHIGTELKFSSGERCHVVSRVSDTEVVVSGPTLELSGFSITRYNTNLTLGSSGAVQTVSGVAEPTETDVEAGTTVISRTYLFDGSPSDFTLRNVRIGVAFALVVLAAPVEVQEGDQIEIIYTCRLTYSGRELREVSLSEVFSGGGYPVEYLSNSIEGDGTSFDVVTANPHHFLAEDAVVVKDAVPLRKAVTSITADGTDWTVVATGHGFSVEDAIEIEDTDVVGYHGQHEVDTVVDVNTFTIFNSNTPDANGATGTVRLATPAGYFNGDFTVASVPDVNTVRITSSITGVPVEPTAILTSPDTAQLGYFGNMNAVTAGMANVRAYSEAVTDANPQPDLDFSATPPGTALHLDNTVVAPRINAGFANDFTYTVTPPVSLAWGASTGNNRVKRIMVGASFSSANPGMRYFLTFTTPQPKLDTHALLFPNFIQKITRDLI